MNKWKENIRLLYAILACSTVLNKIVNDKIIKTVNNVGKKPCTIIKIIA